MIDPKLVHSISTQVYKQFPEVTGVRPNIRLQPVPKNAARIDSRAYLLTYHTRVSGSGGLNFPHWVRVLSDSQGRILKISTSH
jgi:hypothetical protein